MRSMASFTNPNVSNNLLGRELSSIAFDFVRQYYTILNKRPCFIHNFYSHASTFIHGNIEMANEHHVEPIVGREKIKRKMEELKLNDCRAKITQIDCLETLAGGLVIQVIGELSNDGKPMRRFLQTFVLAQSSEEPRQDGDPQHVKANAGSAASDRRGVLLNNDNSNTNSMNRPSHNQRFFVLNSIFRYQDDGPISEFEDDVSVNANTCTDNTNGGNEIATKVEPAKRQQQQSAHGTGVQIGNSNGASAVADYSSRDHSRRPQAPRDYVVRSVDEVERLAHELDDGVKLNKSAAEGSELKRDGQRVVPNGTGNVDKKNETSEKSTENGKVGSDHSQPTASSGPGPIVTSQQPLATPVATVARPQPSNEPKTWANMVRNAHPHSASNQVNVNIHTTPAATPTATSTAAVASAATPTERQQPQQSQHQQHHSSNQQSSVLAHHPLQSQQPQQQQQQLPSQQQQQSSLNHNNNNINNNGRRRHMVRKPSNKSTGRSIKSRSRPPAGKPPVA